MNERCIWRAAELSRLFPDALYIHKGNGRSGRVGEGCSLQPHPCPLPFASLPLLPCFTDAVPSHGTSMPKEIGSKYNPAVACPKNRL